MQTNDRLRLIRKSLKKTQEDFALMFNITQAGYSRIERGEIELTSDKIQRLSEYDININWLLTGQGSMLKKPFINEVNPIAEGDYMMVEYVDLRASAGKLGVGDIEQLPETHRRLVPKDFAKGKFLVVGVDGDSMSDGTTRSLTDGDEVLIYQHEGGWQDPLPIKKTLFVITTRDGNVLKQIKEINTEDEYILCHSFNPSYEDFKIDFSDIYQIFIVCKVVNRQISLI